MFKLTELQYLYTDHKPICIKFMQKEESISMKSFNKFLSNILALCSFSTIAIPSFAISKEPVSIDNFDSRFRSEKTSETVLKYFLGPKAQLSDYWANMIRNIFIEYCGLRKNFAFNDKLKDDGIVPDEKFAKLLQELQDSLRRNHPYYSPRYMAHMLSEQSMPSVLGYFLGLLHNTNNSTAEASPVSTTFEYEYCNNIAKMFGYSTSNDKNNEDEPISWTHLTSGGSVANLEALWISRYTNYAPMIVWDVLNNFELNEGESWSDKLPDIAYLSDMKVLDILRMSPTKKIGLVKTFFDYLCGLEQSEFKDKLDEFIKSSSFNVKENGVNNCDKAIEKLNGRPIKPLYFVPYTAHYCFPKILGMIGEGASSIVKVPVDENFRMDVEALKNIIDKKLFEDNGSCDYYISAVVAVAGTTEEGAVDPVDKILELRKELEKGKYGSEASFWLHIDGAWGGFFKTILGTTDKLEDNRYFKNYEHFKSMSNEDKEKVNDVNKAYLKFKDADSITIDPHKMGYIPYSVGAISFKNRDSLVLIKQLASYINDNYKGEDKGEIDSLADLNDIKAFSPYVFECSKSGAAATSCWFTEKLMPYNYDKEKPNENYHGDVVFDSYKAAQQFHYYLKNFDKIYQSKINEVKDDILKLKTLINKDSEKGVSAYRLLPISKFIDTNVVCFVAVPSDYDEETGFKTCGKINGKEVTQEEIVDYTIDLNNKLYSKYSYQDNTSNLNNPQKYNYFLSKTDLSFYTQNSEKISDSTSEVYSKSHDIVDFVAKELGIKDKKLKEKIRKNLKILRVTIMTPWHSSTEISNETGDKTNALKGVMSDIQKEMIGIISEKYDFKK